MSVANSFEQHTNIIANLLLLFENIAYIEEFNQKKFSKLPNLSMLWRELPILIEHMGQVQVIAVGVIKEGTCSKLDKLKLHTLLKEMTHTNHYK